MKNKILKLCICFCMIVTSVISFVGCSKSKNPSADSYYSLDDVKTVLANTVEMIEEKGEFSAHPLAPLADGQNQNQIDVKKTLKISTSKKYLGNYTYLKEEYMKSYEGTKIYDQNNEPYDIFGDAEAAIKAASALLNDEYYEILRGCAEYTMTGFNMNLRMRIMAYKSQLKIDCFCFQEAGESNPNDQAFSIFISFDKNKEITYVGEAFWGNLITDGEKRYAVYSAEENKSYVFKEEINFAEAYKAELDETIDEFKVIDEDKVIVTGKDIYETWLEALS